MAKFCEFCGQPTPNGVCGCAEYQASVSSNVPPIQGNQNIPQSNMNQPNPQQYQNAQFNQQYPPQGFQPQYQQQNGSNFTDASKKQLSKSKQLFIEFVKNPFKMISEINQIDDKVSPIIFGVLHFIIIYFFIYFKMNPTTANEKSIDSSFSIKITMILLAITFVMTTVTYFVAKKFNRETSFRDNLSVFFVATIPASLILVATYIVGFVSTQFSVLLLFMAFISWVIMSFIGAMECIKADKNVVFWIFLAILAVVLAIAAYIIMKNVSDMVSGFFSDFGIGFDMDSVSDAADTGSDLYDMY
ncbi:MAG: Yip1 family protein [Oscillospiraceae bacterium]